MYIEDVSRRLMKFAEDKDWGKNHLFLVLGN